VSPPFNSMVTVPVEDPGVQTIGSTDPTAKLEPEIGLVRTSKPLVCARTDARCDKTKRATVDRYIMKADCRKLLRVEGIYEWKSQKGQAKKRLCEDI